ncbi:MAG: Isocitrate lyase [Alphaproteobacteria bacterium MarineAlpha9_Bin4]|nr:MAG: Isocitrate lyase [Alphaproteobacteria bacterium MarineAlpha9_Bin4]
MLIDKNEIIKNKQDQLYETKQWKINRWKNIRRDYTQEDVKKISGSLKIEYTIADKGAKKLWNLLTSEPYISTLGTYTGNMAVQQAKAGLKAIYVSGWQVAADANLSGNMYPDQSLYPVDSVPNIVDKINRAFHRADLIQHMEKSEKIDTDNIDYFLPIIADAEAGFGGPLNVFELMKNMIEAGAAGVHFEDQLSSEKKCGHLGGKVLVPTSTFERTLNSARLASDVLNVPTIIMARTDANAAKLLTSDVDDRDKPFLTGDRTEEGFFRITGGLECAVARGKAYSKYADLIWCETDKPDLEEAKKFSEAIKKDFPDKLLAYNCSPSFNWKKNLDDAQINTFQKELGAMDYKFQFITLAGFHNLNLSTFNLAKAYSENGMSAYATLQEEEFSKETEGYTATKHQREVGVSYFDKVAEVLSSGKSSTSAMKDSTETEQFNE